MRNNRISRPILPPRLKTMHKGDAGRVVVVSGSADYSGAPRLAGVGALAVGAGLVRLMVPGCIRSEVAGEDPALMISGLPSTLGGHLAWRGAGRIEAEAARADAVVLGPGLGRHAATQALIRRLVISLEAPMVVDADGLGALVGFELPETAGPRIFTPHPGEAAALLECTAEELQQDREAAVQRLLELLGGILVLKGYGTLVSDGQNMLQNVTGNAGMAVGGMGDILSGMIGGFLAQGMPPMEAVCTAVALHGEAGDTCALEETGQRALTPLDLLRTLPQVMARHERPSRPQGRGRRHR